MPRKPKTVTMRREELFAALKRMRAALDTAAYLQGCRAANPAKHDTTEMREREGRAYRDSFLAERAAIRAFNNTVAALRKEATK